MSDEVGEPSVGEVSATQPSSQAFCTYCSREKNTSAGLLPAGLRYTSRRITQVGDLARRARARLLILSGQFGLLDVHEPIPYYDHLLQPTEVVALAETVEMQLRAMRVSSVRYFTEPSDRNSLTPYFDVIQRATKLAGVAFEVTRLGQEQPMSDWRNIMSRAEQAKRLLNADRHRGEEEFASMLLQFPSDGMIYLKRGEAYEAIGEVRTAASDFERAAALLPMEKWKAIARDALARCAVRAMPQVMSDPPSLSQDTFSDLPSELRDFWRDALGAPTQLPVAQVALQRLAVERSVVHLLRVRTIQVPPRSGLSEQIRLLQENGAVTAATIAHLHTMRSLGNEAAHGGKIGEDELEACRVAANAILKALRAALA